MRRWFACALFLACPFVVGCGGLIRLGSENLYNEAKLYHDEVRECERYTHLARQYWQDVQAHSPDQSYSQDYGAGFQAGFIDYLFAGGHGEPPPFPPKRYRYFKAESPQGIAALQDWYAGFRHGATVAQESGLREFVVVALPPPAAAAPPMPPLPPPLLAPVAPPGTIEQPSLIAPPAPTGTKEEPSAPLPMPKRASVQILSVEPEPQQPKRVLVQVLSVEPEPMQPEREEAP